MEFDNRLGHKTLSSGTIAFYAWRAVSREMQGKLSSLFAHAKSIPLQIPFISVCLVVGTPSSRAQFMQLRRRKALRHSKVLKKPLHRRRNVWSCTVHVSEYLVCAFLCLCAVLAFRLDYTRNNSLSKSMK